MTVNGPKFGKKPSYISDVQLQHTLSPDHKSNSILFDNFSVSILPGGPSVVTRNLSIGFPIIEIVSETELAIDVRGAIFFEGSTKGTLVLRVLGETHVLDPLLGLSSENPGDYLKSFRVKVPAGSEDLRITVVIAVEQGASKQLGQASLTVDSLDLSIGP
jgi:hypothetical protein